MPGPGEELYAVTVSFFGHRVRAEAFTGEGALARADRFFAWAVGQPQVAEVRLTRTDPGGVPEVVRRRGRECPGEPLGELADALEQWQDPTVPIGALRTTARG